MGWERLGWDTDSPNWERRRGEKLQGSQDVKNDRPTLGLLGHAPGTYGEVLEGDLKVRSGAPPEGKPTGSRSSEYAKVHVERRKGEGGAGKPNERLRRPEIH
jgi:hypothetical protein